MLKSIYTLFFILFTFSGLFAQNQLDSLQNIYKNAKNDTTKINTLVLIASKYVNKQDTVLRIATQLLEWSEKIKYYKGQSKTYSLLGNFYYSQKNYTKSIEYYQKGILIDEKQGQIKNVGTNLNHIGLAYERLSDIDNAILSYNKALIIHEKYNNWQGMETPLNNLGLIYHTQSNYAKSLEYHLKCLKVREQQNDERGISMSLQNMGLVYEAQQDYTQALQQYDKSLLIKEKYKDTRGLSMLLNNIGAVYSAKKDYDKALDYYFRSVEMKRQIDNNQRSIAISYNNISLAYNSKGDYTNALNYQQESLQLKKVVNFQLGIATSCVSMADIYRNLNLYDSSIYYAQQAILLAKQLKAAKIESEAYQTLYETYKKKGEYQIALDYFEKYKVLNDSIFNLDKAKAVATLSTTVELERKQKEVALLEKDNELNRISTEKKAQEIAILRKQAETEHFLSLARMEKDKHKADSLLNLAQKAQLEAEKLQIQEERLQAENRANLLEKENANAEKELHRNVNYFIFIGLLGVLLFAVYIFRSRKKLGQANTILVTQNEEIKRQQLEIIEKSNAMVQANEELQQQQEELATLNESLEMQKQEIQFTYVQLKETSDMLGKSIAYASHIQEIILADIQELNAFFNDLFIIYQPKDVVSGDFYWFSQINDKEAVFVLADCTGHGVPGAFMSMLGCTLLHETVNVKGLYNNPANILQDLHIALRSILRQETSENSDGMDISLCYFCKKNDNMTTKLVFSGAKSALHYVDNNILYTINGDRVFLGGHQKEILLQNQEAEINSNSSYYFASDGFADQNDTERRKFGRKALQDMLFTFAHLPMQEQRSIFLDALQKHQGNEPQRDDISLIGLKV